MSVTTLSNNTQDTEAVFGSRESGHAPCFLPRRFLRASRTETDDSDRKPLFSIFPRNTKMPRNTDEVRAPGRALPVQVQGRTGREQWAGGAGRGQDCTPRPLATPAPRSGWTLVQYSTTRFFMSSVTSGAEAWPTMLPTMLVRSDSVRTFSHRARA